MSSMIKDIQSIINNNVSEFIRILSDRYELDINELHNTWGDISLGKDNKKSNDVKTNQKPNEHATPHPARSKIPAHPLPSPQLLDGEIP